MQPGTAENNLASVRVPLRPVVAVNISFSSPRVRSLRIRNASAATTGLCLNGLNG